MSNERSVTLYRFYLYSIYCSLDIFITTFFNKNSNYTILTVTFCETPLYSLYPNSLHFFIRGIDFKIYLPKTQSTLSLINLLRQQDIN